MKRTRFISTSAAKLYSKGDIIYLENGVWKVTEVFTTGVSAVSVTGLEYIWVQIKNYASYHKIKLGYFVGVAMAENKLKSLRQSDTQRKNA